MVINGGFMEVLDIREMDFNKLKLFDDIISTESSLYFDDELFYKFFDSFNKADVNNKRNKLLLLNDGDNSFDAVIPNILINNGNITCGCAMPNIKDAFPLFKYRNSGIFILLLYAVSLSLKKIHNDPRNIVVGDLHFNNILVDKNGKHYFIDFDSCKIGNISQDRLPTTLMEYVNNRGKFQFDVNVETDKLAMFLSTINALFGKKIDTLSIKEYDEKAEQLYTLKNMRNYFLEVKNNGTIICDVPYMSELISINDFPGSKIKIRTR